MNLERSQKYRGNANLFSATLLYDVPLNPGMGPSQIFLAAAALARLSAFKGRIWLLLAPRVSSSI